MKITLDADPVALRYLAFLVENFYAANPAIDDERVTPAPDLPETVQRDLMMQFRDQGIHPSAWTEDMLS
jgi:hypothetical protein